MYELEVCSGGTTEAQPRSFRQNRPDSEYIIWHNAGMVQTSKTDHFGCAQ